MKLKTLLITLISFLILGLTTFLGCQQATHTHDWQEATCTMAKICKTCNQIQGEPLGHDFESTWTIDKAPTYTEEGIKSRHCTRCDQCCDRQIVPVIVCEHQFTDTYTTSLMVIIDLKTTMLCTDQTGMSKLTLAKLAVSAMVDGLYNKDRIGIIADDYTLSPVSVTEKSVINQAVNNLSVSKDAPINQSAIYKATQLLSQEALTEQKRIVIVTDKIEADQNLMETAVNQAFLNYGIQLSIIQTEFDGIQNLEYYNEDFISNADYQLGDNVNDLSAYQKLLRLLWFGNTHINRETLITKIVPMSDLGNINLKIFNCVKDQMILSYPTCQSQGEKQFTCLNCGFIKTEAIQKLNHTFDEDWALIKEATCEEVGLYARYCAICGFKEEYFTNSLGHDYSSKWTIDKEPTCLNEGVKSHHCSRCDSVTGETLINPLGHTGGTATCIALKICTRCNTPYGEYANHKYNESYICTVCGTKKPCDHTANIKEVINLADYGCCDGTITVYKCFCGENTVIDQSFNVENLNCYNTFYLLLLMDHTKTQKADGSTYIEATYKCPTCGAYYEVKLTATKNTDGTYHVKATINLTSKTNVIILKNALYEANLTESEWNALNAIL